MDRRNNANKRRSRITRFVHVWLGRFHSISAKFAEAFSNRGKNLVVGFTAKHEEHKYGFCGGGYIKLLPGDFDQGKAVVPSDFKGNIFVIFLVFATPEFYICCFYFLLYIYIYIYFFFNENVAFRSMHHSLSVTCRQIRWRYSVFHHVRS